MDRFLKKKSQGDLASARTEVLYWLVSNYQEVWCITRPTRTLDNCIGFYSNNFFLYHWCQISVPFFLLSWGQQWHTRAVSSLLELWMTAEGRGWDQTPRWCFIQKNTHCGKHAYSDNSSKADYMHCYTRWSPFSLLFYCSYLTSASFQSFIKH